MNKEEAELLLGLISLHYHGYEEHETHPFNGIYKKLMEIKNQK